MKTKQTQKNIPDGWKVARLNDLTAKIGSGITPRGGSNIYKKTGVMFLRSQNVQNGYLSLGDVVYISEEIDNQMSNSRVLKNDILYNITGASIGRTAIYFLNDGANVNQHVCIIRLKNDNPKFINYFLLSRLGIKQLDSFQAGGNRQGLNYNQLGSFNLNLPTIPEQKRIVKVLETWDEAIEKLGRKIEIKKNIKKGLMQNLLTGKMRLTGFSGEWQTVKLGEVCDIKRGQELSKRKIGNIGKYKCVLYGEIYTTYDEVILDVVSKTNFNEGIKSKKGDVLIPSSTTTSAIDLAVATTVLEDDILLGGDINVLRLKENMNGVFLSYYLTHARKHELARLAQGVTIVHLYGKDFKKLEICIPKIEEQNAIADIFMISESEIEALEKKKKIIEAQKKYLLNNLITGKIRIPNPVK